MNRNIGTRGYSAHIQYTAGRLLPKIIALLMALALLGAMLCFPVGAAETQIYVVDDTFTDMTKPAGLDEWAGWSFTTPLGDGVNAARNAEGYMELSKNKVTTTDFNSERTGFAATGKVGLEMKMRITGANKDLNALFAYNDRGATLFSMYYYAPRGDTPSQYVVRSAGNTDTPIATDVDRWVTIRAEWDFAEAIPTMYFYVDGTLSQEIKGFRGAPTATNLNLAKLLVGIQSDRTQGKIEMEYLRVWTYGAAPAASDVQISQPNSRLYGDYTYASEDNAEESGSTFQWYVKGPEDADFTAIEGAGENSFLPDETYDGKQFQFGVTPRDIRGAVGEEVRSAPFTYTWIPVEEGALPTAIMEPTTGIGSTVTGNYTFQSKASKLEGASEYQWYIADELFGEYTPIEGATAREFNANASTLGRFLKFTVVPVDEDGKRGERAEAFPVLQNLGIYKDFESESDMEDSGFAIDQTGGTIGIQQTPAGSPSEHALTIERTSTAGNITMMDYNFTAIQDDVAYLDFDLYIDMPSGVSETMYLMSGGGNMFKMFVSGTSLYVHDGDGSRVVLSGFNAKKWTHCSIVVHHTTQTIDLYVDGVKYVDGKGYRQPPTTGNLSGIRSYLQNTFVGKVYLDNINIVGSDTDYSVDVQMDTENLELTADLDNVTTSLELPREGSKGSVISWDSSDPSVIARDGTVTRPTYEEGSKTVTLTAYVMKGQSVQNRQFTAFVPREYTDEEAVDADLEAAVQEFGKRFLTDHITLPIAGENGTALTWKSPNPAAVTDDGHITRGNEDQNVAMHLTVRRGNVQKSADMSFVVVRNLPDNAASMERIMTSSQTTANPAVNMTDGDMGSYWRSMAKDDAPTIRIDLGKERHFSELLVYPRSGVADISVSVSEDDITWKSASSQGMRIDANGVGMVPLTISSGRYLKLDITKSGDVVELYELWLPATSEQGAEGGLDELTLDIPDKVTADFMLPGKLGDGTAIKWTSSDTDVIRVSGTKADVTRPSGKDATVVLTAEVTANAKTSQKAFYVTVQAQAPQGGGGGGSRGGGGGAILGIAGGEPQLQPPVQTIPDGNEPAGFADIEDVSWAKDAIMRLAQAGVVNGVSANAFEPERAVTREEFAAMLMRAFDWTDDGMQQALPFADVAEDAWYVSALKAAVAKGVVSGVEETRFGVGENISRQDMAVMIFRALKAAGIDMQQASPSFTDGDQIAAYARDSIGALAALGVFSGMGDGSFQPHGDVTRAQSAVALDNARKWVNG